MHFLPVDANPAAQEIAADGQHAGDPEEAVLSRDAIAEAVVALGPKGSRNARRGG